MQEMDDIRLLREFTQNDSQAAFTALVERRAGLVYSAALRQVRDPHIAEEVTQAVFILLAQKASRIKDNAHLTGWLFQTTRFASIAEIRSSTRRQRQARDFQMQSDLQEPPHHPVWEQLAPHLDEALSKLGEKDRRVVLLRFFENKSLVEVGADLGTSENTAGRRVTRALEKLRQSFLKRGIGATSAVIAGAISTNAIQTAPAGLSISTVTAATGSAGTASALTLVKGTIKLMAWTKVKMTMVVGVGVLLAAATATVITTEVVKRGSTNRFEEVWAHPDASITGALEKLPPILKIRPTRYPNMGQGIWTTTGRAVWVNADIPFMVGLAYDFVETRMILPNDLPRGGFDYINTLPNRTQKSALQTDIKERFGLVAHSEKRETDVLLLKVKDASELQKHLTKGGALENYGTGEGNIQKRIFRNVVLSKLTGQVEGYFKKPTIDRTGLKQHYDFDIQWTEQTWSSSTERMAAVQSALNNQLNQLGLELVPSRATIEILVVERVKN